MVLVEEGGLTGEGQQDNLVMIMSGVWCRCTIFSSVMTPMESMQEDNEHSQV